MEIYIFKHQFINLGRYSMNKKDTPFVSFVKDISNNEALKQEFLDVLDCKSTKEMVEFFERNNYYELSRDECRGVIQSK